MINRKLKIAMIEPIGGHGGLEIYDFGLCSAISRQGHSVTLYTCDRTEMNNKASFPFTVNKVYRGVYGVNNIVLRGICYIRGTIVALAYSVRNGTDISHHHLFEFSWREFFNIALFRMTGVKVVATVHDVEGFDQRKSKINRAVYQRFSFLVDRFVVHTDFARNELKSVMPKDVAKVKYVAHCDLDFLWSNIRSKQEARDAIDFKVPVGMTVFLFFGQIKEVKGLDLLLEAFSVVAHKYSDVCLLIAGKVWHTEFAKYQLKINELGIADLVISRIKYIRDEDVPDYFVASDIAVLPYRKVYNSSVILRAMDYGVPVICSDLPPLLEVVKDRETGFVFKAGDAQELASCMDYALQHRDELEIVKQRAKKMITEKYSWDIIGRETSAVYQSLLTHH